MKGSVMEGDRLEASYVDHCSFGSGPSAVSWWASCMWALLSLSSPPVGVVMTYEQELHSVFSLSQLVSTLVLQDLE